MPDDKNGMTEVNELLSKMEKLSASDLHIKAGAPPIYRVNGTPQRLKTDPYTNEQTETIIREVMKERDVESLEREGAADFAIGLKGVGRFRVAVYRQRGALSLSARRVNPNPPTFEQILMPPAIGRIADYEDGIILAVGPTGCGKSTTLAAIINHINQNRRCHIITIEDPIEYFFHDDRAFVNQREIGIDCPAFHTALRYALRADPDVIFIGEMRDTDTVETAIGAAETGHLVLGTLHASNAMQSIPRMLQFFVPERQPAMRKILSGVLRAVIAQRLVKGTRPEHPRVPAVELMWNNAVIRNHIYDDEDNRIPETMRAYSKDGMQDFNMSLYRLAGEGYITEKVAIQYSPNPEQLKMMFKGMVLNEDMGSFG